MALFLAAFLTYFATSAGQTPYNYFIRLADAFLHGKYYLTESSPWLNELIPLSSGKFAVVYPPGPAVLAVPFIAVFGNFFTQDILSWLVGAATATLWAGFAYKETGNKKISLWVFLLTAFGNITWFMSAAASVWYLGQTFAFLFLSLSLYASKFSKHLWLTSLFLGFAIISRLQIILTLPLILYLNRKKLINFKDWIFFLLPLVIIGSFYAIYNFLRFGSFIETGYSLIPGVLNEPWFEKGLFNFSYIPNHLKIFFGALPIISNKFPFIKPSWGGLAIWLTTPAFIYTLFAKLKDRSNILSWVSIFLIGILVMSHGSTGFTQFGYRFAVDFYALIMFLIVQSIKRTGLRWHHWVLLAISILVNSWGVIFINKLSFVSY